MERIKWMDVAKFFGIWAIYIGHYGTAVGNAYTFVFAFHVPLFFFLVLEESQLTNAIGRERLYLCGNENVIKTIIPLLATVLGLNIQMGNPTSLILYCLILLWLAHRFIIPTEKRIINHVNQYFQQDKK